MSHDTALAHVFQNTAQGIDGKENSFATRHIATRLNGFNIIIIESGTIAWNSGKVIFDTAIKVVTVFLNNRFLVGILGKVNVKEGSAQKLKCRVEVLYDNAHPIDTLIIVLKLICGLVASCLFSVTFPSANIKIHKSLKLYQELKAAQAETKEKQAAAEPTELNTQIEQLSGQVERLTQENSDLQSRLQELSKQREEAGDNVPVAPPPEAPAFDASPVPPPLSDSNSQGEAESKADASAKGPPVSLQAQLQQKKLKKADTSAAPKTESSGGTAGNGAPGQAQPKKEASANIAQAAAARVAARGASGSVSTLTVPKQQPVVQAETEAQKKFRERRERVTAGSSGNTPVGSPTLSPTNQPIKPTVQPTTPASTPKGAPAKQVPATTPTGPAPAKQVLATTPTGAAPAKQAPATTPKAEGSTSKATSTTP